MANNEYANKVVYGNDVLMDLTEDSVSPENLLAGETAHDKSGRPITGSVITHNVVDNLESTSSEDALSANMGRELNETKENKAKVVPWNEWKDYPPELRAKGEYYVPDAPGGVGLVINDGVISDKTLWSSFRIKQEIDKYINDIVVSEESTYSSTKIEQIKSGINSNLSDLSTKVNDNTNHYSDMSSIYFDIESTQYNKLEKIGYMKHFCCSIVLKNNINANVATTIADFPSEFRGSGIGSGTTDTGKSIAAYTNGALRIVSPELINSGTRLFIDLWFH